jgi:hypothetical protein
MSVLASVLASDDRLSGRILEWRPPRWVQVWMLTATRLGDGWLWLATAVLLAASGHRGLRVLSAGAVAAGVANTLLVCLKGLVRRARPASGPGHDISTWVRSPGSLPTASPSPRATP